MSAYYRRASEAYRERERAKARVRSAARYAAKREQICAAWRERYANDPLFRAEEKADARFYYHKRRRAMGCCGHD